MNSKDLARYSIFLAIAVIFSYIEHLVVIPFVFPQHFMHGQYAVTLYSVAPAELVLDDEPLDVTLF